MFFFTRWILNDVETRYVAGSARMKTVTSVNKSHDYYRNFCYAYCFDRYLYFKLDLVHGTEYLEHLASYIFTLFMPFFAYFLYCQYFMFVDLFKSFDFVKNTQNLHIYTNLKKQIRTHFRLPHVPRGQRTIWSISSAKHCTGWVLEWVR